MRDSQRLWFAGVSYALVWGLVVLGFLGPLALMAALATLIVAASLQLREAGALVVTIGGAVAGMVLLGLDGWLVGPVEAMASVYRAHVLSGGEVADLVTVFSQLVRDEQAWIEATPLGVAAGGLGWTLWQAAVPRLRVRQGRGAAAGAVVANSASQVENPRAARGNTIPDRIVGGSTINAARRAELTRNPSKLDAPTGARCPGSQNNDAATKAIAFG